MVVDYARQIGLPTSVDLPDSGTLPIVSGARLTRVQTLHYPKDLEAILRRISYTARTAIEESGTNMLYLIFGFLEWFESDSSEQPRLAPLLLLPVTIERGRSDHTSGTFAYEINHSSGDQIEENLSLREKLKCDFGLDMSELSEEETPESYFTKFRSILAAMPRWRLRRRVTLGMAYFGKLLMFKDLNPKSWSKEADLLEHPRIRDLFEGPKLSEAALAEEYAIDAPDQQQRVPPLILDADSSQHSALIDATEGKNLVIEGPPGTGKSQTIANLVAIALANGKTVLFVSEKLAALEVVRRRLDHAGLGLFCLELHSHKTDKRKLLDELKERLEARGSFKTPKDLAEKKGLLQRAKQELIEYAELMNRPFNALGNTGFDVIWRRERLRQELSFDPKLIERILLDRDSKSTLIDFESDCQVLDVFGRHLAELRKRFPDIQAHPWRKISNASLDYSQEIELFRNLEEIRSATQELRIAGEELALMTRSAIGTFATHDSIVRLNAKADQIPSVEEATKRILLRAVANPGRESVLRLLIRDVTAWKSSRATLVEKFSNVQGRDPSVLEPLRLVCQRAVECGIGNFDRAALIDLATECESLRTLMKTTSVLTRESLANGLSTCESATRISRVFGSAYRAAKLAFRETFASEKRPRRQVMMQVLRRALTLVETLEADRDFAACHRGCISYNVLGSLVETARSAAASFDRFSIGEGRSARGVLANIFEFSANCKVAADIANHHPARELIGPAFRGVDTNLTLISEAINEVAMIRQADLPPKIEEWLLDGETDTRLSLFRAGLTKLCKRLRPLDEALSRLCELGQIDPQEWWGPKPWALATLQRAAETALGARDSLPGWLEFLRARREVKSANLDGIAKLAESNAIAAHDLVPAYTYIFYNALAQELTRSQPKLLQFSGLQQEAVRERFVRFDKELIEMNRQSMALLASTRFIPHGARSGPAGQRTELALLEQEMAKQKRHIPIRQLVRRAGGALQALKPCFMMGPLSVAQYLPPGQLKFDLVVMDEASQLKPEDALGTIARGDQLVVVGDPKQLPPPTFFERQLDTDFDDDGAEEISTIEQQESILDVATALYQPIRQLRWHYRSRHDSLIAFSNAAFYRSRLLVFPSPTRRGQQGVQFRYVANGVYEAGRAKWNRPEAERLVNLVLHHMQTSPELSLGVVALNYQQRELIEDLLTERIRSDEIAQLFIERYKDTSEPFFIKNLENVQGDERDVIFISVTYGRDQNRNLFQRFGPINQAQGPRRLNVLFTRAKHQVVVFSSIDPDELRTDVSTPAGVAILKAYLKYAKTGLLETETYSSREPANDFEIAVSNALSARGFECVPQIGVAGFFIDIGVRHPNKPGLFVLGIECDGATYHSAKSARDRDRLRQAILENLGWNIHRIWSTDWLKDSRNEIEKVVESIRKITADKIPFTHANTAQIRPTAAAADRDQRQSSLFGAVDGLAPPERRTGGEDD